MQQTLEVDFYLPPRFRFVCEVDSHYVCIVVSLANGGIDGHVVRVGSGQILKPGVYLWQVVLKRLEHSLTI